ncbi:MAG: hypothetical protein HS116_06520 [Planctomycetes bacterium]|nr:hypothetical protein [Planctomycetota bacterium]
MNRTGDDTGNLMLTPIARSIKKHLPELHLAVSSPDTEVFRNNPCFDEIRAWHLFSTRRTVSIPSARREQRHPHRVEDLWMDVWDFLLEWGWVRGERLPMDGRHPELFLDEAELARGKILLEKADLPAVALAHGGESQSTHNQEWGRENIQRLSNALATHATLLLLNGNREVAVLAPGKPPRNVQVGFRELVAMLAACDACVSQEGRWAHLARAVKVPAVVIYGGAIHPWNVGYDRTIPLYTRPHCSPCLSHRLDCVHLKCMLPITPRKVGEALQSLLKTNAIFLPDQILQAAPDRWQPPAFVDGAIAQAVACDMDAVSLNDGRPLLDPCDVPPPTVASNLKFLENGVTAHRGSSGDFPENTMAAIRHALSIGVDWIEIDVQATRDGDLVVLHDRRTERVGDLDRKARETVYARLREVDVAHAFRKKHGLTVEACPVQRVPRLAEVLFLIRSQCATRLCIHPKQCDVADIIKLIESMQAEAWVGFNDGNIEALLKVKQMDPRYPVCWCPLSQKSADIYSEKHELDWNTLRAKFDEDLETAKRAGFEWLVMHTDQATQEKVEKIHAAGMLACVWTANDADAMRRLLDFGVDRIFTDFPARLMQVRESMGLSTRGPRKSL